MTGERVHRVAESGFRPAGVPAPGDLMRAYLREAEPEGLRYLTSVQQQLQEDLQDLVGPRPPEEIARAARQVALRSAKNNRLRVMPPEAVGELRALLRFQGEAELLARAREGRPAILAFAHLGPARVLSFGLDALGLPVTRLNGLRNGQERFTHLRSWDPGLGEDAVPLFLKHAADELRQGRMVLLAADGELGQAPLELPCLGRRLPFQRGPFLLHRLTGAPLIPLSAHWDPDDAGIVIRVHPPLAADGAGEPERALGAQMARWLEDLLRADPGQIRIERLVKYVDAPSAG